MTVNQAIKFLNVSRSTINRYMRAKVFNHYKNPVTGRVRIEKRSIQAFKWRRAGYGDLVKRQSREAPEDRGNFNGKAKIEL